MLQMLTNIQYVCNIEGRALKTGLLVFQDLLAFGFNLATVLMELLVGK